MPRAYGQGESPKTLYQCAVEALDKKDCKTTISCLEKYKIQRAEELKKNPKFAGDIDLQISNCRNAPSSAVKIIADAEPSIDTGGGSRGAQLPPPPPQIAPGVFAAIAAGFVAIFAAASGAANH